MAIMLKLITNNLFSKKKTRLFPSVPERETFERSRGRIIFNDKTCILCSICARKCPADAITVDRSTGKWALDAFRCVVCSECVSVCPKKSITMSNKRRNGSEELVFETFHVELQKTPPKSI